MESKNKLKEITINDEKSFKNILVYDISYKNLVGAKNHCILGLIK